ncbi:PD40 domain-containing protein [bacterium]|nr:PD40 domain-containing protein [bacterium]
MNVKHCAISFFILAGGCAAQLQEYNHPELSWQTIETDHFYIHFHEGTERTAFAAADIAEHVYGPVTGLYEYRPDGPVHIVIRDHDDISNGAAFYYDNKIELWAPPMDFLLRGTHAWLKNVLAHEFSHMVSLGAARKGPRRVPAVYLQWMGYEREKRPDVIHGYPNVIASFPLAGTVVPMWFAEGMAQFQQERFDYDRWDSHRDMILRTAVLEGRMLTLDQMSVFGKNSLGNEKVYEHGYGLSLYIAAAWGEETLPRLARAMSRPLRTGFSGAVQEVLGISAAELYGQWRLWLEGAYRTAGGRIQEHEVQGEPLTAAGMAHLYPVFSPDGSRAAYLSSGSADYMSQLNLIVRSLETGGTVTAVKGVTSAAAWSPDGGSLVYAKNTRKNAQGSYFYDLYVYDVGSGKETRLTTGRRARHPDWSAAGGIVSIVESDGTSNLARCNADGTSFRVITSFHNGEQLFTPRWTPDGERIIFSVAAGNHGRDIGVINADGSGLHYLCDSNADERDPRPLPDGSGLVYAADPTGIFNLYLLRYGEAAPIPLTNVIGGAFMPSAGGDGSILYSQYDATGYHLRLLRQPAAVPEQDAVYRGPYRDYMQKRTEAAARDSIVVHQHTAAPYRTMLTGLSFLPRVMMDYPDRLKLGSYFYGSDFLDRISLLGGAAANTLFDTDLFAIFEYRRLYPTLFLEAYHQQRHTSAEDADYRFQLFEIDLGADWRLSKRDVLRTAWIFSRYDAKMSFEDQGYTFNMHYTYHLGNQVRLEWTHTSVPPSQQSGIAPSAGRRFRLRIDGANQRFIRGFKVNQSYGTLVEDYDTYRYLQAELDWREYMPGLFRRHGIAARLRAGLISDSVDGFYHLFAGGLDGIKGYPYYSIEGTRLLHLQMAYRFPLADFPDTRVGIFNLDDLYLSLYCDAGTAWSEGYIKPDDFKRDAGVQLRLSLFSFYGYPTSISFDAVYGFDRFIHMEQRYGREWRFYFGLLFDFLD